MPKEKRLWLVRFADGGLHSGQRTFDLRDYGQIFENYTTILFGVLELSGLGNFRSRVGQLFLLVIGSVTICVLIGNLNTMAKETAYF